MERLSRFVSTLEERTPFAEREFKILSTSADGESVLAHASPKVSSSPGIRMVEDANEHGLRLEGVCVDTPGGERRVVHDVTLTVRPGEKLLIVGRSGQGKTSLLRAIAGLWTEGEGRVIRPPREKVFFMPQRTYCVQGTLRSQLLYPRGVAHEDSKLKQALAEVALGDLCERVGGLDAERDWGDFLSVGETQRLAFARAVLEKPRVVLVDEGTAAVDHVTEEVLMKVLDGLGCAVDSVGHRRSLVGMHDRVLHLKDGERAEVVEAEEFVYPGGA